MKRLIWNRHTKLVLKHSAGWFCIVAGLIMCITPGQGILTLLIGVYLLADEIPFFGKIKTWLEHRFPRTAAYVHRKGEQMRKKFRKKPPAPPTDKAESGNKPTANERE